jgi:tRNA pseudouridine38-40 synthase
VRTLLSSAWDERSPELLCYRVHGTGFLHHMVRNLVGTFLEVGRGQIEPGAIVSILAARDRSAAGATAPARGLFLESVEY